MKLYMKKESAGIQETAAGDASNRSHTSSKSTPNDLMNPGMSTLMAILAASATQAQRPSGGASRVPSVGTARPRHMRQIADSTYDGPSKNRDRQRNMTVNLRNSG